MSRFYWKNDRNRSTASKPGEGFLAGRGYITGWLLLGFLTVTFLLWLWIRFISQPSWLRKLPESAAEMLNLLELGWGLTLVLLWIGLLWRYRRNRRTNRFYTLTYDQLITMEPVDFERYVAGLFEEKGYRVVHRGGSGDHGVDLELTSQSGKQAIVQCKRYQGTVGEDVVRDLFGTLMHERVARAFLVTTGEISESAKNWADGKPLTLIDGHTLLNVAAHFSGVKGD
jgi:hypothetical protein